MKVIRERPSQRLYFRVTAPLYVDLGTHTCRAADWGLGGLLIDDFAGALPGLHERMDASLALPFQGFNVSFDVQIEAVRIDEDTRLVAFRIVTLGERERELMRHFIDELVRGSMVSLEETIQRIDVPVTPVSMEPDPNPNSMVPARRRHHKTIMVTAFYLILGVFIAGYVLILIYSNFFRMEITSAVVSAPVDVVTASGDGRMGPVYKMPGDEVRMGEVLALVEDHDLEKEIEFARLDVTEQENLLRAARQGLDEARARANDYAIVTRNDLSNLQNQIKAARVWLDAARQQVLRFENLFRDGWVTAPQLATARSEHADAQARYQQLNLHLKERRALQAGQSYFDGRLFLGDLPAMETRVSFLQQEHQRALEAVRALLRQKHRLSVIAPFDGTIKTLLHTKGSAINRGDLLAVIERRSRLYVDVFLNQEEVLKIGMGDKATVYLPSLQRRLTMQVVGLDRTYGFIDEQNDRHRWRGTRDRAARVMLALPNGRPLHYLANVIPGLPAVVTFKRRSRGFFVKETPDGQAA